MLSESRNFKDENILSYFCVVHNSNKKIKQGSEFIQSFFYFYKKRMLNYAKATYFFKKTHKKLCKNNTFFRKKTHNLGCLSHITVKAHPVIMILSQ